MASGVTQRKEDTKPAWIMGSQRATIHELPKGAMLMIFSCLAIPEVVSLRRVSREWKTLLDDRSLWNYFRWRDFGCQEEAKMPKNNYRRRCDSIAPPAKTSPGALEFQDLSQEIKLAIFRRLPLREALVASTVCENWRQLLSDDSLWKEFLGQHFGPDSVKKGKNAKELFWDCHVTSKIAQGEYAIKEITVDLGPRITCCSKGSEELFSITPDGTLAVLDVNSNRLQIDARSFIKNSVTGRICAGAMTVNGLLVLGDHAGCLYVFDLEEGTLRTTLSEPATNSRPVHSILVPKNESQAIAVSENGEVRVWNLATGKCERSDFQPYSHTIKFGCLTSFYEDRLILASRSKTSIPNKDHTEISASILSEDGTKVILGNKIRRIRIWNLETGECEKIFQMPGLSSYPTCFSFTENGNLIIGSSEETVDIYDLANDRELHTYREPVWQCRKNEFKFIKSFDNDKLLIVTQKHGSVFLVDPEQFHGFKSSPGPILSCSNAIFTSKGKLIIESDEKYIIMDFNTSEKKNLEITASIFEEKDPFAQTKAMEQFNLLPQETKKLIYDELDILLPSIPEEQKNGDGSSDYAESAFHDRDGVSSTPQQKAQAIRNYLRTRENWKLELLRFQEETKAHHLKLPSLGLSW